MCSWPVVLQCTWHSDCKVVVSCCLGPLDGPDTDGTAEAEEAAAKAHDKSDNPDDVMDALEAAEAVYNQAHPEETAGQCIACIAH